MNRFVPKCHYKMQTKKVSVFWSKTKTRKRFHKVVVVFVYFYLISNVEICGNNSTNKRSVWTNTPWAYSIWTCEFCDRWLATVGKALKWETQKSFRFCYKHFIHFWGKNELYLRYKIRQQWNLCKYISSAYVCLFDISYHTVLSLFLLNKFTP